MRDYTSRSYMSPLSILSLLGRGLSTRRNSLMELVRDTRRSLLPSVMGGGAFLCLQSSASTNSVVNTQWSTSTDLLLALVLVTCFFCDTACSTALEIFTETLIAPSWHRVHEHRPAHHRTQEDAPARLFDACDFSVPPLASVFACR